MKTTLLKKVRSRVIIVDKFGNTAQEGCKFNSIIIKNLKGKVVKIPTTRDDLHYIKYKWAVKRAREVALEMARQMNEKSWFWHVFH